MSARNLSTSFVIVIFLVLAAAATPPAQEQQSAPAATSLEIPRGLDGKPDLSGYWRPRREPGKPGGNLGKDEPNFILPFSELGKRAHLYSQNHTVDPEAICILGGIPRHNGSGLAFEILHTPQRLATLYQYNTHRWVTIGDNLKHPENPDPRYFGHAIAHWEGDTLVIETVGLRDSSRDKIWLDENGDPTSDATRVVERWSLPDSTHINLDMTVTDLKYYTRPFRFVRTWVRAEPGQGQTEYPCNENNEVGAEIGPGAGVIGPDGNRGYGYGGRNLPENPPGPEAYGF